MPSLPHAANPPGACKGILGSPTVRGILAPDTPGRHERAVPSDITRPLRSENWWNNPSAPGMTALYLERFLNYGLTRSELQSGRPVRMVLTRSEDFLTTTPAPAASIIFIALLLRFVIENSMYNKPEYKD